MNRNKIKYTITIYVPGSQCNLKCEYCYVSKCIDETHLKKGVYEYPLETMIEAFSPDRLGGIADFVVIGSGETLMSEKIVPFVHGLLKQGHVVEVVTNMTLTNRIDELLDFPKECLERLIVKGSLHWNELKRLNKVDEYFDNIKKIIAAGASSFPFFVAGEAYEQDFEKISSYSIEKIGTPPHCTPCIIFDEKTDLNRNGHLKSSPECTGAFVNRIDKLFESKIFDLSVKWMDIDPKQIFCYAGKWSFIVDIGNGNMFKCHACPSEYNFFEDIYKMPKLEAVGNNCQINSCSLQYNFIAQGLIPKQDSPETYSDILVKDKLFNDKIKELLNFKYYNINKTYTKRQEQKVNKKVGKIFFNLINNRHQNNIFNKMFSIIRKY